MARQGKAAVAVCDSCVEAILEEAGGDGFSWDEATGMARTFGQEVADHICYARDEGEPCGCACRNYDTPRRPSLRADIVDGLTHL